MAFSLPFDLQFRRKSMGKKKMDGTGKVPPTPGGGDPFPKSDEEDDPAPRGASTSVGAKIDILEIRKALEGVPEVYLDPLVQPLLGEK